MCECYDPNGPKYCNIHKEFTNGGLEKVLNEFNYKTDSSIYKTQD